MFGSSNNNKRKSGYEPVPDVEKGEAGGDATSTKITTTKTNTAKAEWKSRQQAKTTVHPVADAKKKYAELNLDDQQAKLLGTLDSAIQNAGKLDLDLAGMALLSTSSSGINGKTSDAVQDKIEAYMIQGKEFAMDILSPTITSIATVGIAVYLQGQARLMQESEAIGNGIDDVRSSWTAVAILVFPYVNATLVFLAMAMPLQNRFMSVMIDPVFRAFHQAEAFLKATVEELGPFVDETIDGIQADFHGMMKPIQPKLDLLSSQAHLAEQVLDQFETTDDLDIPDPSDIDRELDEAQGIVGTKMEEAEKHLEFEAFVPNYLESPKQFYWRIVFPIIVLAWVLQMTVAYVSTNRPAVAAAAAAAQHGWQQQQSQHQSIGDEHHHHRYLDVVLLEEPSRMDDEDIDSDNQVNSNSIRDDSAQKIHEFRENMTAKLDQTVDDVRHKVSEFKEMGNATFHSLLAQNASAQLHGYEEELKEQFETYKGDFDQAVLQSKSLVKDVLWSYAMAVAQMLLIYILTSEAVQAWVVRQGMNQVQKGAERTLEEYGVVGALDDVFGARLNRVQTKILKLLRIYKKIEGSLGKAAAMANVKLPDAELMEDAMKKGGDAVKKGGDYFGKMFKKK